MRSAILFSALAGVVLGHGGPTGALGNAKTTTNADNIMYHGSLSSDTVTGSIDIVAGPAGNGLSYSLKLTKAPTNVGALSYYIATSSVKVGASCDALGGVFDPYVRGADPVCETDDPATCRVGDLSGKYGTLRVTSTGTGTKSFSDFYTSSTIGDFAFVGNRSIVISDSTNKAHACANFLRMEM
ncbi:hypothetical protein P152DRAFT_511783 [Eremomyces bilateralis CBS 781.70]|uniref:Uncharacterized protein n=1 Tax=Eremomyces bilateralis CBS 781.70 TaxID=1392243 RepID=A0A6G1GC45_9PEZI|nr:uncharacterized protein P152DRAFT_511783 [Eremomyces bilateralis CBS 781.70]KAF1815665.1 hypothetical protein P152DRAFT_511783 [Eremomyces bilateralis CBS 781.70]